MQTSNLTNKNGTKVHSLRNQVSFKFINFNTKIFQSLNNEGKYKIMNSGKYLYKNSINKNSKMKKQISKQMNNGSKFPKKVKKEENNLINKKKKREEEKNINNNNKKEINQNIYKQGIPIENPMNQMRIQNIYYQYYQNQMEFNQILSQKEYNYDLKEITDKIYSRGIVNNIIGAFFIDKCIQDEKQKNKEENKLEEKINSKSEEKELSSENEENNNNNENNEQNLNEIRNDENINIGNNIKDFQNDNKLIKPILIW